MTTKTRKTLEQLGKIIGYIPTFGTMLKSMRECEQMSQAEFSRLLDITPQKLCDIEKGRRFVGPKTAEAFAKKLNNSPEYFVIRCLQDELDRNKINVHLKMSHSDGFRQSNLRLSV